MYIKHKNKCKNIKYKITYMCKIYRVVSIYLSGYSTRVRTSVSLNLKMLRERTKNKYYTKNKLISSFYDLFMRERFENCFGELYIISICSVHEMTLNFFFFFCYTRICDTPLQ